MEAYFHSDPHIEVWVNQIIEKLFSVSSLTGIDAEVEFQSGCQIVSKLTRLLQGISVFPSEYLEDGLKQLLEQQLPDSRVISNFPGFQDTMYKMIHEGMIRAGDTENALNIDLDAEHVIPALASVNSIMPNLKEVKGVLKDSFSVIVSTLAPKIPAKPYGIKRKTQVPEQADRLQYVLNIIFPNGSIGWNLNLMGYTFLAQVEDILIYIDNPELPCHVENFNREGWKVFICSADDLMFPRRLERGIRQIQRTGKQYK